MNEPITNADLAQLIRDVSAVLDNVDTNTIETAVAPLREVVAPNTHVGRGDEMDHTEAGFRLQLEWYAGQLLAMIDNQQWGGINSWINCTDKFTVPKAAP